MAKKFYNMAKKFYREEFATIRKDLDIYLGYLHRVENPDPVLRTETCGKGLKLYDEVERDSHVHSVMQTRILAVVGKDWEITPATGPTRKGRAPTVTQEQKIADFISRTLVRSNFDQARQDLLKAILYGFSVAEIIWKPDGPDLGIDKIIGKHPRRFIFDKERNLRLLSWDSMIEGEDVPACKFIPFTYGDSDNPYGRGLGQKLWWPVWFKKNVIKFWMVFLEKFGMPTVVGKYEQGAGPEQKTALFEAIDAIQNETGITIPSSTEVEFLEATRAGTVSYEQCCEFMDKQISKAVLGQTATTEGTPGKLGNEQTQGDVRQDIIEADADLLDTVLNNTLIKWIVDYNFEGVTDYPQIKTSASCKPDLSARILIDEKAVSLGVKIPLTYFHDTYGYPQAQEGEEVAEAAQKALGPLPGSLGPLPGSLGPLGSKQFSESKPAQDAVDLIADQTAQTAMGVTDEIYMAPLKHLVEEAKDMEDLRGHILDLWGAMDPESLGVIIAQGMMLAEMTGRYKVSLETGGKKKV